MKHKIKVPKTADMEFLSDLPDVIDDYIDAQVLERLKGVVSDGGIGNDVDEKLNRQYAEYIKKCIRDDIVENRTEIRVSLTTKGGKLKGMLYHNSYEEIYIGEIKWLTEDIEYSERKYIKEILVALKHEVSVVEAALAKVIKEETE